MNTIIIGAGASGLACAIRLKQNLPSEEVTILERLDSPAKKLYATGNGRCNLSNVKAENHKDIIQFLREIGLVTRIESSGLIYPYSNQASTVVDVLVSSCNKLGVKIITGCTVTDVSKDLTVTTDKGEFKCTHLVVACGGKAQQALGSNGSGYKILEKLCHTITPLYPELVQLTSPNKTVKKLKGKRVKCNMAITLDDKIIQQENGEVLFTDYGLSGIVSMNLSHIVSKNFASESPEKCHAILDLVPEMDVKGIVEYIKKFKSLTGILGDLSPVIMKQADNDIEKAASYAKHWKIIINGTKGFEYAQITGGGASLDEFENFCSKKTDNLYACGEVLDCQFPCGGFNLTFAFHSGITVADEIAKSIIKG